MNHPPKFEQMSLAQYNRTTGNNIPREHGHTWWCPHFKFQLVITIVEAGCCSVDVKPENSPEQDEKNERGYQEWRKGILDIQNMMELIHDGHGSKKKEK